MPRPRRRGLTLVVLAVGLLGGLPGFFLLSSLIGPLPALLGAAALSAPLAVRVRRGLFADASEAGLLGASLLVFYAWWGGSLLSLFAWLPSALGAFLLGLPASAGREAALVVGLSGGLLGVTWNRLHARLARVEVQSGAFAALDGYRVAQLSDLHLGGHTPASRVRAWVDRVNALSVDLVAVTGDLITTGDEHLESVARELGRLRARDGVALCLGNHDYFADTERLVAALEREGIEVLRNRGRVVDSPRGRYFLAGVDDTWSGRADPVAALAGRPRDLPSLVLLHDPGLFDECARLGADLVLSGHTHGGQVAFPIFSRTLNLARLVHRYSAGLYRRGESFLYVTLGAGTTGPPLRIGAPSEIALITLRALPARA